MRNCYEILNVAPGSEAGDIRTAYRALIRKYHPDRFDGDGAHAEAMSKLINEAYAVLRDPGQRRAHDEALRQVSPASWAPSRSDVSHGSDPASARAQASAGRTWGQTAQESRSGLVEAVYGRESLGIDYGWAALLIIAAAYLMLPDDRQAAAYGEAKFSSPEASTGRHAGIARPDGVGPALPGIARGAFAGSGRLGLEFGSNRPSGDRTAMPAVGEG